MLESNRYAREVMDDRKYQNMEQNESDYDEVHSLDSLFYPQYMITGRETNILIMNQLHQGYLETDLGNYFVTYTLLTTSERNYII